MIMHNVTNSSQVSAFGYDPVTKRLTVIFKSGGYDYLDVPAPIFDRMLKNFEDGGSVGSWIGKWLKPHFKFEKHPLIQHIAQTAKCGNVMTGTPCENSSAAECAGCLACPDTGEPAPCDKLPCCQGVKGCDEN